MNFSIRSNFENYRNFTEFPGVEILRKGTVSAEFWVILPKLCGNFAFPQNFHIRKIGEITAFYAIIYINKQKFQTYALLL